MNSMTRNEGYILCPSRDAVEKGVGVLLEIIKGKKFG